MKDRKISRFNIYAYTDPRTSEIRYVGKSTTGSKRPFDLEGHDHGHVGNWIENLSKDDLVPEVSIVEQFDDACFLREAEMWWIYYWRDMMNCDLTNLTDGGEIGSVCGVSTDAGRASITRAQKGRIHTVKEIEKMKASLRGRDTWMKGRKHTQTSILRMSKSLSGSNHPNWGKKRDPLISVKVGRAVSKKIMCLDDGRTFSSGREVAKHYGIPTSNLSRHLHGKCPRIAGLHFVFVHETEAF